MVKMDNLAGFVERLSDYMILHSLTTREIANLSGYSKTSVDAWLKHNIFPSINNLTRLADYFNCSMEYLLGLSENKSFAKSKSNASFFDRFALLLKIGNLTVYGLSRNINLSQACMARWKNGRLPTIESLLLLSEYFSCSPDYLLGRSDSI